MSFPAPASFYLDKTKVEEYIDAREGLDANFPVRMLRKLVAGNSSVLEVGMGPGKDLLLLSRHFRATGSDYSPHFLNYFRAHHDGLDLLLLDAVTLETDQTFDCIFSNKVLHHLDDAQLDSSLVRQTEVVRPGGILFHTFWLGDESNESGGLLFRKYKKEFLVEKMSSVGRVISSGPYAELIEGDSFFVAVQTTADAGL